MGFKVEFAIPWILFLPRADFRFEELDEVIGASFEGPAESLSNHQRLEWK